MFSPMNCISLFVLVAFQTQCITECTESSQRSLQPEKSLLNQVLFHDQIAVYKAVNLLQNSAYEVRVSYPAVVPTEFLIEIVPPHEHSSYRTRHVLNIEKTVFSTDNVTKGYLIKVIAHRVGFPLKAERLKDPVVYDILLETLYVGLSVNSWKIVGCACLIFVATFKYLAPLAHRYIMSLIQKNKHTS